MNNTQKIGAALVLALAIGTGGVTVTMLTDSPAQTADPGNDRNGDGAVDLADALIPLEDFGAEFGKANPCVQWVLDNALPTLPAGWQWRNSDGESGGTPDSGFYNVPYDHPWYYGQRLGTPVPIRVCVSNAAATAEWSKFRATAAALDKTATRTPYPANTPSGAGGGDEVDPGESARSR